jgi:hypothetical protein
MNLIEALFQPTVSDRALEQGAAALQRLRGWWLSGPALERLAISPPRDADPRSGEFIVLLARTTPSPVISDGLALPLRWVRKSQHDRKLPRALRELADRIRASSREPEAGEFRLTLGDACPDLSWCEIGAESAGAMLSATLRIAVADALPDALVSASAEWTGEQCLRPVDGLSAKCEIAARLGLRAVWVAPTQEELAAPGRAVAVHRLPGEKAHDQIDALVVELDAKPPPSNLAAACAWYHRNRARKGDREREARAYYCRELAARLASHARTADEPARRTAQVETLIVIATGQPSAAFAAAFLQPKRVFIAHTQDDQGVRYGRDTADSVAQVSAGIEVLMMPLPATPPGDFATWRDAVRTRLAAALDPEGVRHTALDRRRERSAAAIDLTGGTTMIKLAFSDVAQELGFPRTIVDGSETPHARGGHDVSTLRVVTIPPRAG